jgi:hypothetical protein
LAVLGAIFTKGFREAIGVGVLIVSTYLPVTKTGWKKILHLRDSNKCHFTGTLFS